MTTLTPPQANRSARIHTQAETRALASISFIRLWLAMRFSAVALLLAWILTPALALSPAEEKGLEIAVEADRRDEGWKDQKADLLMILRNRHGQESVRELRNRSLEVADDGDKLLVIFDRPRDVDGTAFLTFTHKEGQDDQWLYLPALKRIKRISSNNKSGPFMGSEFAYEDLTSQEIEKYTYKHLRDEAVDGLDCFVVARIPVDPKSTLR